MLQENLIEQNVYETYLTPTLLLEFFVSIWPNFSFLFYPKWHTFVIRIDQPLQFTSSQTPVPVHFLKAHYLFLQHAFCTRLISDFIVITHFLMFLQLIFFLLHLACSLDYIQNGLWSYCSVDHMRKHIWSYPTAHHHHCIPHKFS